ncbi:MAG: hypothetical protein IJQ12_04065 [Lachnospiraceae bacterium]|nr:hypothetical protein [Lachnospiraceae bacterium]
MRQAHEKKVFAAYLVFFFVIATSLAVLQPLTSTHPLLPEPPDEYARFQIPLFICKNGFLPTGLEPEMQAFYAGLYAMRPSLPSVIMGFLMRLMTSFSLPEEGLLLTARMVNVASGLVTAVFLYLFAQRRFRNPSYVWLFCIATLFLPQHLFVYTYVNNDGMCMTSVVVMCYAMYAIAQEGFSYRRSLALGTGWIMCLLTYYNAYGFVMMTGMAFIGFFFEKGHGGVRRFRGDLFLRYGVFAILLTCAGAGWWFVRSFFVLDGDLFAMRVTQAMHDPIATQLIHEGNGVLQAIGLMAARGAFRIVAASLIAVYGSMHMVASIWYYVIYGCLVLMFAVAALWYLIRYAGKEPPRQKILAAALSVACLITVALWLYYCLHIDYQPQGRYILPVIIPFYAAAVSGMQRITEGDNKKMRAQMIPKMLCVVLMVLLLFYLIVYAYPVYLDARGI